MTTDTLEIALDEDYPEIRESVRRICEDFPGAYWRKLEDDKAYPTEFVRALTEAGYLGALIPEEYGGSEMPLRAAAVILETIQNSSRQP
jgi:acyl-CoA dehydrogenase